MNLQKLTQQLKYEATAHPVKAGALAVGLLLAVWFWIPLVAKMFGGGEPSPAPMTSRAPFTSTTVTTTTASNLSSNSTAVKNALSPNSAVAASATKWQELREWMEIDPRMAAAPKLLSQHDPFRPLPRSTPRQAVLKDSDAEQATIAPGPVFTPEMVGLELTSTLVGSTRSVAMINDKTYRLTRTDRGVECEPEFVQAPWNGQEIRFTLVSVLPKSVILESNGHRHRLKLADTNIDEAITISSVTSQD